MHHSDSLTRQVMEGVIIKNTDPGTLLNSCTEFCQPRVTRQTGVTKKQKRLFHPLSNFKMAREWGGR